MTRETIEESRREEGRIADTCSGELYEPGTFQWFKAWSDARTFNAQALSDHHRDYVAGLTVGGRVRRTRTSEGHYLDATERSHDELLALGVDRVVLPIPQDDDGDATLARLGFSPEEIQTASRG